MPKVPDDYMKARASEILAAAAACFARSGFGGTSMADIARQAGLSVGALYRYFDCKDALFQELTRTARRMNRALWAEMKSSGDPAGQLCAFVERYMDSVGDPRCAPGLALDIRLRAEALDAKVVRREMQTAVEAQTAMIAGLLHAANPTPGQEAAQAAAVAVIGMLNEAAVQALLVPDFDLAAYRKAVLELIRKWQGGRRRSRPMKG